MDIKQDQAIKRLLKKLSALRATLSNEERRILDGLVTSSTVEVEAHSMMVTPISPAKATSPDEVKALSMKVNTAKSLAKATSADEAKALSMKVNTAKSLAKATSADETAAHSMTVTIIYDAAKDEYSRIS
jgi:hypothetical protein